MERNEEDILRTQTHEHLVTLVLQLLKITDELRDNNTLLKKEVSELRVQLSREKKQSTQTKTGANKRSRGVRETTTKRKPKATGDLPAEREIKRIDDNLVVRPTIVDHTEALKAMSNTFRRRVPRLHIVDDE